MEQEQKANGKSPADGYAELRRLVLGPDAEQLAILRARLADPQQRAEDLSEVLPAAVRLRAGRDGQMRSSMEPLVEESIRLSVEKHPEVLAAALFPILGAAVRKAVSSALQGLIQTLNQVVEQSLSWRSLAWRWEALRTGRSFGEIVLIRSLLYRVEQVFLIHKETGLLLQQRAAESMVIRDADLVSGMLTAIQDFVRDSFGARPSDELETLRVGDFDVWIQHGPHATLAAVIRGTPPRELRSVFEGTLEKIHGKLGSELAAFDGDTSAFAACQEDLKGCFLGQGSGKRRGIPWIWWVLAAAAVAALAFWIYSGMRERQRWDAYLAQVRAQPGVVVTGVDQSGGGYQVSGLRDPMALDPTALLTGSGIDSKRVSFHWEPYQSMQPAFEAARRLANEIQIVEGETLHFGPRLTELSEADVAIVDQIAGHIQTLVEVASKQHRPVQILIAGHTDDTGNETLNRTLSNARADGVKQTLIDAGVPPEPLMTRGVGTSQPLRSGTTDTARLFNRYVSFQVQLGQPE